MDEEKSNLCGLANFLVQFVFLKTNYFLSRMGTSPPASTHSTKPRATPRQDIVSQDTSANALRDVCATSGRRGSVMSGTDS